jgi:hypothetical protein
MPLYRNTDLQHQARFPAMTELVVKRAYAPEGRCIEASCGCVLSKYRAKGEVRCAPCSRKHELNLATRTPPKDRYRLAREMLDAGCTFTEVAREMGWATSASACSAVRHWEARNGVPRAGNSKAMHTKKRRAA